MRVRQFVLFTALMATRAAAHSISNEAALGFTQDTPANPHGTNYSDQLITRFDLNDDWSLKLGGSYTHETSVAPAPGAFFPTSTAEIGSLLLGADWDVSPRVNLSIDASISPRSTQTLDAVVQYSIERPPTPTNPTPPPIVLPSDVLLHNATAAYGAQLGVSVVVGGDEFLGVPLGGTLLDASVGWMLFDTEQKVQKVYSAQMERAFSLDALRAGCKQASTTQQRTACRRLAAALNGGEDTLNQVSLSLSVLQPIGETTYVGLTGGYYLYDKDPDFAGVFATRVSSNLGTSLGVGLPLAPPLFVLRPQLEQRLGRWTVGLWYQFTEYASDNGYAHSLGTRIAFRIDANWQVWVSGSAQWDHLAELVSAPDTSSAGAGSFTSITSGTVALGFRAKF